jgi:hypothetical protein
MLRNTKKYKSPFGGLSESGDSVYASVGWGELKSRESLTHQTFHVLKAVQLYS